MTSTTQRNQLIHCNRCTARTSHVHKGRCDHPSEEFDEGSRTNIQFNEAYELWQCLVCGQARLQVTLWNSENDAGSPAYYPPSRIRRWPEWMSTLDDTRRWLFEEVYDALDAGANSVAIMGLRAILDVWVTSQIPGAKMGFEKKLDALVKAGTLTTRQADMLLSTFDTGSASAHRGHRPMAEDVMAAMDAVENALQLDGLAPRIARMTDNTPKRSDS